jgi:hypothetical protein
LSSAAKLGLRRQIAAALLSVVGIVGLVVAMETPAAASTSCQERLTPYYWTQTSCLEYKQAPLFEPGMWGYGEVQMLTGFNRSHVKFCKAYLQLKSSYGTLTPPEVWDCLGNAQRGGRFDFPAAAWHPWGTGRRSGDSYTQYAWMEVWTTTGGHYDGRPWAAKVTITKP